MSGLFRSERMRYVQLSIPKDASHAALSALGDLACVHVIDLNHGRDTSHGQMTAKKRVMDCVNWDKRLRYIEERIRAFNIPLPELSSVEDSTVAPELSFMIHGDRLLEMANAVEPMEAELFRDERFRRESSQQLNELMERKQVLTLLMSLVQQPSQLREAEHSIREQTGPVTPQSIEPQKKMSDLEAQEDEDKSLRYICGVIPAARFISFERVLFRSTRGKLFIKSDTIAGDLTDTTTGEKVEKMVFCVYFLGQWLERKIAKVCDAFQATRYAPVPVDLIHRHLDEISKRTHENLQVHKQTLIALLTLLNRLAFDHTMGGSPLRRWQIVVRKELAMAEMMRRLSVDKNFVHLHGWIPYDMTATVQNRLQEVMAGFGQNVGIFFPERKDQPPTYFRTDKFTSVYQSIIQTYGTARYGEINPALFSVVTFPFLFAVMWGDMVHGSFLTLVGALLILLEKKLLDRERKGRLDEFLGMAFSGRYMLFMMGLFSIFCGAIYNDAVSLSIDAFGSHYKRPPLNETTINNSTRLLYDWDGGVYPFGVDPAWNGKKNALTFFNSLKMKFAVILGVVQMTLGSLLSGANYLHFGDVIGFFFVFIPELTFLLSTFGYMDFIIVYKFCVDWNHSNSNPPNLISTMMDMFLDLGGVPKDSELYSNQVFVQRILLICAVVSIPIMLLIKPIVLVCRHKAIPRRPSIVYLIPQKSSNDIRRLNLEADKVKPTTDETDVKEKYKYKEADKEKEEKMKEKDSESVIALPPEVERRGDTTNTPSTRQDTMSGRKDRDTVTSISTITPITGGETSTRVGGAVQEGGERGEGGGIGERGRGGQREKEARRTPSVSVSEQYDPNRVISLPASPGTSGEKGVEKIEEKKRSGTSLHSVSLPSSPSSPSSFPSSPSAVGSPSTGRPSTAHKINFDANEIFIQQAIHTIEFVLSAVSNTASYLRLWALSLAHAELADVFFDKAMRGMMKTGNPVMIWAGWAVWACATVGVLGMMDVLECFLHALRLHWVEFMSKFYMGDGYLFEPFSFKAVVDQLILEDGMEREASQ